MKKRLSQMNGNRESEGNKSIDHKSEVSAFQLEVQEIEYLTESKLKKWILAPLLIFTSCGILYLLSFMYTSVNMLLYFSKVDKISDATHCKVTGGWNNRYSKQAEIVELKRINCKFKDNQFFESENFNKSVRFEYLFIFKHTTYIYDYEDKVFIQLKFNYHQSFKKLRSIYIGVQEDIHHQLLEKYGKCIIDIKVKPIYRILFEDVINWFYLFQIAAITLWMCDVYYRYAIAMIVMISFSLFGETKNIYDNLHQLREMAKYECDIKARRIDCQGNKVWVNIKSSELVPGDIFEIPEGCKFPCDALMLSGQCVVNESMLTGESTPAVKFSMPKTEEHCKDFNIENKEQAKFFLFSGTEVIQIKPSNGECLAMAIKTGFDSEKGELIRSILFPIPDRFRFALEMNLYMIVTGSIATIGLCTVYWVLIKYYSVWNIILKSCEILFLAIPPELPVVLSLGLIFSMQKLKSSMIYCINSAKIREAGLISIMVLDKTGTLTEEGLSVDGSCILNSGEFTNKIPPTEKPFLIDKVWTDRNELNRIYINY